MGRLRDSWLGLVILLGTAVYVVAEDITLTTYYPSPRGIYQTLRSTGQTTLAEAGGNVGIGTTVPGTKLDVNGAGRIQGGLEVTDTIAIRGGSPGANKVLTSDGSGNATWQDPVYAP